MLICSPFIYIKKNEKVSKIEVESISETKQQQKRLKYELKSTLMMRLLRRMMRIAHIILLRPIIGMTGRRSIVMRMMMMSACR